MLTARHGNSTSEFRSTHVTFLLMKCLTSYFHVVSSFTVSLTHRRHTNNYVSLLLCACFKICYRNCWHFSSARFYTTGFLSQIPSFPESWWAKGSVINNMKNNFITLSRQTWLLACFHNSSPKRKCVVRILKEKYFPYLCKGFSNKLNFPNDIF